jgi:hypothetical protein
MAGRPKIFPGDRASRTPDTNTCRNMNNENG